MTIKIGDKVRRFADWPDQPAGRIDPSEIRTVTDVETIGDDVRYLALDGGKCVWDADFYRPVDSNSYSDTNHGN